MSPTFYDLRPQLSSLPVVSRYLNRAQVLQSRVPLKGLRTGVSGAGMGETMSRHGPSLLLLVQVFYILFLPL